MYHEVVQDVCLQDDVVFIFFNHSKKLYLIDVYNLIKSKADLFKTFGIADLI